MVDALLPVEAAEDVRQLKALIQQHLKMTGSAVARRILLNWDRERSAFVKVYPLEYRWVWGHARTCVWMRGWGWGCAGVGVGVRAGVGGGACVGVGVWVCARTLCVRAAACRCCVEPLQHALLHPACHAGAPRHFTFHNN